MPSGALGPEVVPASLPSPPPPPQSSLLMCLFSLMNHLNDLFLKDITKNIDESQQEKSQAR